jgi:predicted DNA-binding ribbon-helix-helix protein
MKSTAIRHSIMLGERRTSVILEDAFWTGLKEIADLQRVTVSKLIAEIDATRKQSNLSSEIRIFVLQHFQSKYKSADLPTSNDTTISRGPPPQAWRGFARRG